MMVTGVMSPKQDVKWVIIKRTNTFFFFWLLLPPVKQDGCPFHVPPDHFQQLEEVVHTDPGARAAGYRTVLAISFTFRFSSSPRVFATEACTAGCEVQVGLDPHGGFSGSVTLHGRKEGTLLIPSMLWSARWRRSRERLSLSLPLSATS